ncbi:MAG TPA: YraN family protein [Nakamurella sp.]|jgi:putative endonuclease|nr:YraN family protein [Nakamurella sp.]
MAMAAKDELGRRGEQLAVEHLEQQGLVVLSRNWRCPEGELDIVATDGLSTVVFCEVKTRSGTGFGAPVEAVTRGKRRRIRRLANLWLIKAKPQSWTISRFDVIGILLQDGAKPQIQHIAEAF